MPPVEGSPGYCVFVFSCWETETLPRKGKGVILRSPWCSSLSWRPVPLGFLVEKLVGPECHQPPVILVASGCKLGSLRRKWRWMFHEYAWSVLLKGKEGFFWSWPQGYKCTLLNSSCGSLKGMNRAPETGNWGGSLVIMEGLLFAILIVFKGLNFHSSNEFSEIMSALSRYPGVESHEMLRT